MYIDFKIKSWPFRSNNGITLNSLFGAVKLTTNPDPYRYSCSGHGISFDVCGTFQLPNGGFGKNVVIFGTDMGSSVHVDNKKKDILIYGKGPTQGLDNTT